MVARVGFVVAVCAVVLLAAVAFAGVFTLPEDLPKIAIDRRQIGIELSGSLQNPAWSPHGDSFVFTRYRDGYGHGEADLYIHDLRSGKTRVLLKDGFDNVNQPGSAWNPNTGRIAFSSTRQHTDQIHSIRSNGDPASVAQHTHNPDVAAYEPSFSPDGKSVAFETHHAGEHDNGVIAIARLERSGELRRITAADKDCRQPNWSPAGRYIVYQCLEHNQWDLWIFDVRTGKETQLTRGDGDKTDASFSPDGRWIVYSVDNGQQQIGDLFIIPVSGKPAVQLTRNPYYEGAPSWSPDGRYVIFESMIGPPNKYSSAAIWRVTVPERFWRAN